MSGVQPTLVLFCGMGLVLVRYTSGAQFGVMLAKPAVVYAAHALPSP